MKKIKVIFNWNRPKGKEITMQVSESWSNSQINAALEKKYGTYDILRWHFISEEVPA